MKEKHSGMIVYIVQEIIKHVVNTISSNDIKTQNTMDRFLNNDKE